MRIVQVIPELKLAGAEIMCESLSYELMALGHDVTVVSLYNTRTPITERLEQAGIKVEFLGKKRGLAPSIIFKLKKILKKQRADVVHTHLHCTKYAVPAAILAGVGRRVHTLHNIAKKESGSLDRGLNKFFFKRCGLVPVALSAAVQDTVVEEYRIDKDKIPVVFNGIDLSKCIPKESYSVNGSFRILHIGRFREVKNHRGLIDAFEILHSRHFESELLLIGDGEIKSEIESLVSERGLGGCVKLLGLQSDVHAFLHDADLFTLPSHYEGVPMTLIEAMGTGLPIVATAVGGVPDMLDDRCAILTQVDSNEIAEAFERLYSSEEIREAYGKNALARSCDFSSKIMAEKYLQIYNEKFDRSLADF